MRVFQNFLEKMAKSHSWKQKWFIIPILYIKPMVIRTVTSSSCITNVVTSPPHTPKEVEEAQVVVASDLTYHVTDATFFDVIDV